MPVSNRNKLLLIVLMIVVAGFLAFLTFNSVQFRITSMTPDNNKYPDIMSVMEVHFNKKLDKDALEERLDSGGAGNLLKTSFEGENHISVSEDYLTITFGSTPLEGEYSLEFIDITAESGDSLSETVPLIVKHIKFEDLSTRDKALYEKYQADQVGDGDIGTLEDPFLQKLPHETGSYLISYEFADEEAEIPTITVTLKLFPPGSNAAPPTPQETAEYEASIRQFRSEAVEWIKENGGDLEKYYVRYSEPELVNEFPAGRQ